jgi:hypothetical protein
LEVLEDGRCAGVRADDSIHGAAVGEQPPCDLERCLRDLLAEEGGGLRARHCEEANAPRDASDACVWRLPRQAPEEVDRAHSADLVLDELEHAALLAGEAILDAQVRSLAFNNLAGSERERGERDDRKCFSAPLFDDGSKSEPNEDFDSNNLA